VGDVQGFRAWRSVWKGVQPSRRPQTTGHSIEGCVAGRKHTRQHVSSKWELALANGCVHKIITSEPIRSCSFHFRRRRLFARLTLRRRSSQESRRNRISWNGGVRQQADVSLLGRATGRPREGEWEHKGRVMASLFTTNQRGRFWWSLQLRPPPQRPSAEFSSRPMYMLATDMETGSTMAAPGRDSAVAVAAL
jgi:hypothetical protein